MYKKLTFLITLLLAVYFVNNTHPIPRKQIPLGRPSEVELFMDRIADIESGGNYKITNEFGMMGRYQFSPGTVRALGFNVSRTEFLNNPSLQDSVMIAYMRANHEELEALINKYEGKRVNGINITRASILAGAHFAGSHGVRAYLNGRNTTMADARGTTLTKYMGYFSNFNLPKI
jgi:hypothetical protein